MSHAIAALPQVFLLSEVNPLASPTSGTFTPLDPLAQYVARYGPQSKIELQRSFLERLAPVVADIERMNGFLVLRDHAHSDWLTTHSRGYSALQSALQTSYDTISIVTLRNPIESYSSMILRGWHKGVGSFDGYCERIISFLDYFDDCDIFHYEDFVTRPDDVLSSISRALEVPFAQDWQTRFREVILTGDSGRGANEPIQLLPIKPISSKLASEIRESRNFACLCDRLGYATDPDELIEARRDEIAKMRTSQQRLRWRLDDKMSEIAALRESIARLEHSIEHQAQIAAARQMTIDTMRKCLTWRLTAPLRSFRTLFRSE